MLGTKKVREVAWSWRVCVEDLRVKRLPCLLTYIEELGYLLGCWLVM
jgi:hypothetical protein